MNNKKNRLVHSQLEYIKFVGECISGWKGAELHLERTNKLLNQFGQPDEYPADVVFSLELEEGDERGDWLRPVFGIERHVIQTYIQKFK